MVATNAALGKIICFHCRRTDCVGGPCHAAPRKLRWSGELTRAGAWIGGACVAGTALGAALALLFAG